MLINTIRFVVAEGESDLEFEASSQFPIAAPAVGTRMELADYGSVNVDSVLLSFDTAKDDPGPYDAEMLTIVRCSPLGGVTHCHATDELASRPGL